MRDELFRQEIAKQFEFDKNVAEVFDDMLSRSVPFYSEVLNLSCALSLKALQNTQDKCVLDLGSSTGNFLISLSQILNRAKIRANLLGIDNSEAMIEKSTQKVANTQESSSNITFLCQDFLKHNFLPSRVVSAHYTMQFVRPIARGALIKKIYDALESGGIFIMSEKTSAQSKVLDFWLIDLYEQYKLSQGYSQNEINQKRARLQNVLVAFSLDENIQMLKTAGFSDIEVCFCYLNFATLIAYKK